MKILVVLCAAIALSQCVHVEVQKFGSLYNQENSHHQIKEKKQDLSKVPGIPGVDYPIYHSVPETNFHCAHVPAVPGMYANVETGCQAYHVCHDGREGHQGASFLCTNGTLFNQKLFACDWWYNVHCEEATKYYSLNADPATNPFAPKPKPLEEHHQQHETEHQQYQHGDYQQEEQQQQYHQQPHQQYQQHEYQPQQHQYEDY